MRSVLCSAARIRCALILFIDRLETSVLVMFAVAIFISYGLQCYVPVDVVWNGYLKPRLEAAGSQRLLLWEYGLRLFLCLLTC